MVHVRRSANAGRFPPSLGQFYDRGLTHWVHADKRMR
jgi:hypothetical protein